MDINTRKRNGKKKLKVGRKEGGFVDWDMEEARKMDVRMKNGKREEREVEDQWA